MLDSKQTLGEAMEVQIVGAPLDTLRKLQLLTKILMLDKTDTKINGMRRTSTTMINIISRLTRRHIKNPTKSLTNQMDMATHPSITNRGHHPRKTAVRINTTIAFTIREMEEYHKSMVMGMNESEDLRIGTDQRIYLSTKGQDQDVSSPYPAFRPFHPSVCCGLQRGGRD
jgi:hypothetical protein